MILCIFTYKIYCGSCLYPSYSVARDQEDMAVPNTALRHKTGKGRTAASPRLVFREAGMQVYPAKISCPSPRASAPPCLPLL
jgi:hypothetical protein